MRSAYADTDPQAAAVDGSAAETVVHSPLTSKLVRLRDGSSVSVRPVGPSDEAPLHTFLVGLCGEARRLRFFTGAADLDRAAHLAADPAMRGYGLLAHDEMGVLVAHAAYVKIDDARAEVAVEVADHLHGRGLGTSLIERLAAVAEEYGIAKFLAEVLPENREMLHVFRDGFDAKVAFHEGTEIVEFPTSAWRVARERFGSESPS